MTAPTPAERAEWRKLADEATPAPWAIPVANVFRVIAPDSPHTNPKQGLSPPYPWRVIADMGDPDGTASDAAFIAAARSALPRLLDALDEAEKLLREARALLRDARDNLDHSPAAGNHTLAVLKCHPNRCLGCVTERDIDTWRGLESPEPDMGSGL